MNRFQILLVAGLLLAFCTASSAQAEVRKLRVEHYLQPNNNGGGKFCYVVSDGVVVQLLDQPIAGFNWQWGVLYKITVNVDRAVRPDGSVGLRYTLISVDSQERVPEGTRFEMYLFDRSFIQGQTILGVKAFKCANASVEEELKRRLDNLARKPAIPGAQQEAFGKQQGAVPEQTRRVLLEFSHPKTAAEPLILQSITSASDLGLE